MKAVILAGGRGTRLAPYTTILPKPLMPLGNHPVLEIILCQLRKYGFTEITMAVGYLRHLLEAYFEHGERIGVHIDYSYEDEPLGTAGPLSLISGLDEPFLVMNGDVLTDLDFGALYAYHLEHHATATISLYPKTVEISLGVLEVDEASDVISYQEKPTYSYLASMGIYVLSPGALQVLEKGQRCDFPDLVRRLLDRREKVVGRVFNGDWVDIGQPQDYLRAVENYEYLFNAATLAVDTVLPPTNGYRPELTAIGSQST
jgi:NDP-sugar pyrophosphorylase family protein